jgi:hypothetical protein
MRLLNYALPLTAATLSLLFLAGCAGAPKAPGCNGTYRSLNPAHYLQVKEAASDATLS